jgi:hypothetical protein
LQESICKTWKRKPTKFTFWEAKKTKRREAQAYGDDHENGDDRSEADAGNGSIFVSGQSEWDEEEDAETTAIIRFRIA